MRELIELRDLEAFVAVADSGSFTTAAQKLLLTQPTVSARIATLERALDVRLFDRGPGMARTTPAGDVLLPRARALLRDREEAVRAVEDFLSRLTGTLKVGASSVPGSYMLPKVLATLREAHPRLRVSLLVADTEAAVKLLREGEVELAVVGREVAAEGLEGTRLGDDEVVLVATPALASQFRASSRKGLSVLEDMPLVLREPGSATRAVALQAIADAGVDIARLDVALEASGNSAAREAALGGLGAAFLSRLAVGDEVAAGRLEVLQAAMPPIIRPIVLLTRSGKTLSPAARELVGLLTRREAPGVAQPAARRKPPERPARASRARRA